MRPAARLLPFADRRAAGRALATQLAGSDWHEPLVLALPRGGVPVAVEVAEALHADWEVFVARKVGAPHQPELGIGAVAEGGTTVADRATCRALGVSAEAFERLAAKARVELERRVATYRGGRALPDTTARDVLLVDDGLATGVTAEASLAALRATGAARLVLAVPVAAPDSVTRLRAVADDVVTLAQPSPFGAVGQFYERFDQTTDEEVFELLARRGVAGARAGYPSIGGDAQEVDRWR
jgi:putative phosphoribosyl transferase